MSAIDHAFIRAYTLDTAAASATIDSEHRDAAALVEAERGAAPPQRSGSRVASQPSPASSALRTSSRRSAATAVPIAAAQSMGVRTANPALPPRRPATATAAAPAPALKFARPKASVPSAVPAPHFCLSAFVHSTSTLDPSMTSEMVVAPQLAMPIVPAAQCPALAAELPVEEPATVETELPAAAAEVKPAEPPLALPPPVSPPLVPPQLLVPPAIEPAAPQPASAPAIPAVDVSAADVPIPPAAPLPTIGQPAESPSSAAPEPTPTPDAPSAAFEVDHFVWPELCDSLLEKRAGEFDQLVGQLVTESALGRKVIAITGSRRGDGRTTLALLLARRLAATAVKVVVVDADFEVPQLGARLGMTVESGWERVLADGLPVWDGLIESLRDRVTLLPLAPRPASISAQPPAAEFVATHAAAIRQHLDTLRKHFDVVLVDAGAVKAVRADAKPRGPLALAEALDAAIMVSDARVAAPGRVGELQRRLAESRIVPLGVAENFSPSKSH